MQDNQIEALLNGRYGSVAPIIIAVFGILVLIRKGYLTWSSDKVTIRKDESHIMLLESLRSEIARLNEQMISERARCDRKIDELQSRIFELERTLYRG